MFCEDWLWQAGWTKQPPVGPKRAMGKGAACPDEMQLTEAVSKPTTSKAEPTAEQINELLEFLEWLEHSWYKDSELQKSVSEDELLKFIEYIAESAKQQVD
ncbi:hypothetical protein ACFL1G_09265 [Planctomycetota bacterium]